MCSTEVCRPTGHVAPPLKSAHVVPKLLNSNMYDKVFNWLSLSVSITTKINKIGQQLAATSQEKVMYFFQRLKDLSN